MRPSSRRLVQVISRKLLNVPETKIHPPPLSQHIERQQKTTFIDVLLKQKEEAGDAWPQNIRIERQLKKADFRPVDPNVRATLKRMAREQ